MHRQRRKPDKKKTLNQLKSSQLKKKQNAENIFITVEQSDLPIMNKIS